MRKFFIMHIFLGSWPQENLALDVTSRQWTDCIFRQLFGTDFSTSTICGGYCRHELPVVCKHTTKVGYVVVGFVEGRKERETREYVCYVSVCVLRACWLAGGGCGSVKHSLWSDWTIHSGRTSASGQHSENVTKQHATLTTLTYTK